MKKRINLKVLAISIAVLVVVSGITPCIAVSNPASNAVSKEGMQFNDTTHVQHQIPFSPLPINEYNLMKDRNTSISNKALAATSTGIVIDLNSTSANVTIYGEDASETLGDSVSSGDINGDGVDDVIIGARFADAPGGYDAGRIYVIYGGSLPSTIDLNSVSADVTIYGDDEYEDSGENVDSGDINGDGIDDLIIGAPFAYAAGRTYVIYGGNLPSTIGLNSVSADVTIYGNDFCEYSGSSVSSGDINGDGIDDLIIGAPQANPMDRNLAGVTYVIYGSSSLPSIIDLNSVSADVTIYGDDSHDYTGSSVSSGDINGDGIGDMIIRAYNAGKTHVIHGSSSLPSTIDLNSVSADVTVINYGDDASEDTGCSVSSGDINGDGIDDLIIGAYGADPVGRGNAGEAYVIYGGSNLPSTIGLNSALADVTILGDNAGDYSSGVSPGDINSDGIDDVIIGAPGGSAVGETYVIYVSTSSTPDLTILEDALDRYQQRVNQFYDDYANAFAGANAKLYKKYGESYSDNVTNYFGYRANIDKICPPQELKNIMDGTRPITPEEANSRYLFLKEMYGSVNQGMTEIKINDVFYSYYMGTAPDQENFLLGDHGINALKQEFNNKFTTAESIFLTDLSELNLPQSDINNITNGIDEATNSVDEFKPLYEDFYQGAELYTEGNIAHGIMFETTYNIDPLCGLGFYMVGMLGAKALVIGKGLIIAAGAATAGYVASNTIFNSNVAPVVGTTTTGGSATSQSSYIHTNADPMASLKEAQNKANIELVDAEIKTQTWRNIEKVQDINDGLNTVKDIYDLEIVDINTPPILSPDPNDPEELFGHQTGTITIENKGGNPINPYLEIKIDGPSECTATIIDKTTELKGHEIKTLKISYEVNLAELDEKGICGVYTLTVDYSVRVAVPIATVIVQVPAPSVPSEISESFKIPIYSPSRSKSSTFHAYDQGNTALDSSMQCVSSDVFAEDYIEEGEINQYSYGTALNTDRVTFILPYPGSDLDLHLYDSSGRHAGINYNTGKIETKIPYATYSGSDSNPEWITIDNSNGQNYNLNVVAMQTIGTESYSIVAIESPEFPALLAISPLNLNVSAPQGDTCECTLVLSEYGGFNDLGGISFTASDLTDGMGGVIPSSSLTFDMPSTNVQAGSAMIVNLTIDIPTDVVEGRTYSGTITAEDDSGAVDNASVNVVISTSQIPTVIFQDDFDSYSAGTFPSSGGWQLIYSGYGNSHQVVDNSQYVSSPNSFKLEGRANWAANAYHPLNQTPDLVSYEADVMVTQPESSVMNYGDAALALSNPNIGTWGTYYGQVTFDRAKNRVIQPGNIPYNFGVWYPIKVTVDMKKRVYDVWVDDQLVASNIPTSSNGDYTGFRVEAGNNAHAKVWFDNIKVEASGEDLITVDDSGGADYTHIQEAVNNARSGSAIKVFPGTYKEHLVIDKPLKLIGEDKDTTIIDGGGSGNCVHVTADNVKISGFAIQKGSDGVLLESSDGCTISGNMIWDNYDGICLTDSNNNIITNNILFNNVFSFSGIHLSSSNNNVISDNELVENGRGISLYNSNNNLIYHNNFVDSIFKQAYDNTGTNSWDNGPTEGGNYWSDHGCIGNPSDGSQPYYIDSDSVDHYPFQESNGWIKESKPPIFDTGEPANPYPSIFGTHNGTIKPNQTITVHKLYTYPCSGTGGHTEYARIWNATLNVVAEWEGYKGDWHNITFNETFVLYKNKTYNYTIRTGSYPQIIHTPEHTTLDGSFINCTSFVDANGKNYNDWIPAIRLFLQ